jgi:hypothetical protein
MSKIAEIYRRETRVRPAEFEKYCHGRYKGDAARARCMARVEYNDKHWDAPREKHIRRKTLSDCDSIKNDKKRATCKKRIQEAIETLEALKALPRL